VATARVVREFTDKELYDSISKHAIGEWGDIGGEAWRANNLAVLNGTNILSSYRVGDAGKILWIITEAADEKGKRESTTFLLPEEY
jgi:hypothetical protein